MKLELSRTEIIKRRRIAGGFDYTSTAATVESTTGIDLDAYLGRDTRRRYLELLDTAPRRLLAPSDIAAGCSLAKGTDGGPETYIIDEAALGLLLGDTTQPTT